MDVYTTEEQQLAAIKKWWQEHAAVAALGVALVVGAVFGWRHWQEQSRQQSAAASRDYQKIVLAVHERDYDAAEQAAEQLLREYPRGSYAVFARLLLAKIAVEEDALEAASRHLRAALKKNGDPTLEHVIRLRLARVLLAREDAAGAAELLAVGKVGDFAASYAELRGDVKARQGDVAAARAAYAAALQAARRGERDASSIEIKLNDLGRP